MRASHLIFFLFVTAGCTYDHANEQSCAPPPVISFAQDIQPVFDAHCATIDCHTGNFPAANLQLEAGQSYLALHDPGSGYLDTLRPKFSVLYAQMISVSNPMPPNEKLDDCTIALVLHWIEQGAKNN